MTAVRLVVFCHVACALGLFATLAIEWVSLRRLASSTTYEQAREWSGIWNLLLPLGMPATLVALASGIYLATTLGAWGLDWVRVAIPTLVMVAVAGAVVGPRRNRLQSALTTSEGALSSEVRQELRHPLLVASWRLRAALLMGLVFVMTARPESALLAMGLFALTGGIWSVPAWRTQDQRDRAR